MLKVRITVIDQTLRGQWTCATRHSASSRFERAKIGDIALSLQPNEWPLTKAVANNMIARAKRFFTAVALAVWVMRRRASKLNQGSRSFTRFPSHCCF
jgi:hypothetical protein